MSSQYDYIIVGGGSAGCALTPSAVSATAGAWPVQGQMTTRAPEPKAAAGLAKADEHFGEDVPR